jgi:hypothetical protein
MFTVHGNRICWNVVVQLGITDIADEQFRTSDWVPQQNQKYMDSIRHFVTPYGTLGDLFDATPIEQVSKVYFEDQLFETWNHERTVLIGDGMCCGFFPTTVLTFALKTVVYNVVMRLSTLLLLFCSVSFFYSCP